MIYKEEQRDLFSVSSDYYLAHCISADFKMGAGIAKKFTEMGTREYLFDLFDGKPYPWNGTGAYVYTWAANAKGKYKGVFHLQPDVILGRCQVLVVVPEQCLHCSGLILIASRSYESSVLVRFARTFLVASIYRNGPNAFR